MRVLPSAKLVAYGSVTAAGLFGGLLVHRLEVVLLVAPFAVALVSGLVLTGRPELTASASLSGDRAVEGDAVALRVVVEAREATGLVEVAAHLPEALVADGRSSTGILVDRPGEHRAELPIRASRWGAYAIGPLALRVHDPGRLLRFEEVVEQSLGLRVHPPPELLRRLLQPSRTTPFPGGHTARRPGEVIEFAEVRPYVAGDRLADLNPRVSARRGAPFVNLRHPERHANVVVLLDTTFEEALEATVRGAVALVRAYGAERDRVGLVAFGSIVRWVRPGLGDRHLYRVLDALLTSEVPFTYLWHDLHVVPPRMLPPNALVWLVSPLEDDRPARVVHRLRRRGFDVSVLEIALDAGATPGPGEAGELAFRLWRLRREGRRRALRETGSPVVAWAMDRPMTLVLEEAAAYRARRPMRARS